MIQIDELTEIERSQLLADLLRRNVGGVPSLFEGYDAIPLSGDVAPDSVELVSAVAQQRFVAKKLIVLEPTLERIITDTRTTEKGFFSKRIEREETRTFVSSQLFRSVWDVKAIYIGSTSPIPTVASISGSAFGPDTEVSLRDLVAATGGSISVQVKHNCVDTVRFNAIVLGRYEAEPVKEQGRAGSIFEDLFGEKPKRKARKPKKTT